MGKVIEFYKSDNVGNLLLFTGQFPENNILECDFLSATTTNSEELIIKTVADFMHQYKYTGKVL